MASRSDGWSPLEDVSEHYEAFERWQKSRVLSSKKYKLDAEEQTARHEAAQIILQESRKRRSASKGLDRHGAEGSV